MSGMGLTPQAAAQSICPDMFDAVECRQWVIAATRGEHPQCPACDGQLTDTELDRLLNGKNIICGSCGIKSAPRSGTILEGSSLTDQQIMFILALLHWDLPVYQIATMADCSTYAVYSWRNRLMPDA